MINTYETLEVVKIAEFLKLRKKTQSPTVLFLGSRTGGLFRSSFLYETLDPLHTGGIKRVSFLQRFAACFHILKTLGQQERDEIMRTALRQVSVGEVEACIAQFAKRGFFNMLVATDGATLLESAFVSIGMKAMRDFDVFPAKNDITRIPGRDTNRKPLFTLIRYFDGLAPGNSTFESHTGHLEAMERLNELMDGMRNWNILIVGFDPTWDQHILPKLFPRGRNVWYINEELPPEHSFLANYLQQCEAQCIFGSQGKYEHFFRELSDLIGESDPYHPTPKSGPLVPFADIERTVVLKRSLQERVQEVRSKEPFPPTSLTVKVHRLYSSLPCGVFAYYDVQTMPLIRYEITNREKKAVNFVLATEIQGFSRLHVDTVEVQAQSSCVYYQLPHLDEEEVRTLTETTSVVVRVRINYLRDVVELPYNELDLEVFLMARNVIRWVVPDIVKGSGYLPLFNHIAAWVTPSTDAVRAMLRNAMDYHPQKALIGYPRRPDPKVPRSQVKAIFQALKKVGKIAHVNAPFVVGSGGNDRIQTIHLPDETLRECQANGIDGAVLYASLIECVSLQPVIVIQTKHAFVGWKTSKDAPSYEFLETTMTLSHSFEDALAKGMENYLLLQEAGWFDRESFDSRGFARLLDIKELRGFGMVPMQ